MELFRREVHAEAGAVGKGCQAIGLDGAASQGDKRVAGDVVFHEGIAGPGAATRRHLRRGNLQRREIVDRRAKGVRHDGDIPAFRQGGDFAIAGEAPAYTQVRLQDAYRASP
ncbi:hypothetical protein D3C86_1574720 [compost metagenome]